jgi:hypothetical protein
MLYPHDAWLMPKAGLFGAKNNIFFSSYVIRMYDTIKGYQIK